MLLYMMKYFAMFVLTLQIMVYRLYDVLHSEQKLTLVFEYCDQDLKKYFDSCNGEIDQDVVKVKHCEFRTKIASTIQTIRTQCNVISIAFVVVVLLPAVARTQFLSQS